MNRTAFRPLHPLLPLAALLLAACSGGVPTTQNPETATATASVYSGPAPASADVEAFKVNSVAEHRHVLALRRLSQGRRPIADVCALG